jgi:energy-coupling factor transporter ATP-binding protein EcfA2
MIGIPITILLLLIIIIEIMIYHLDFKGKGTDAFSQRLKDVLPRKGIAFKPGLNLLVGPNGSGKSTILQALARHLYCYQGREQCVSTYGRNLQIPGISVEHSGDPVFYCDPLQNIEGGLQGELYRQQFLENTEQGSSGEHVQYRLHEALKVIAGDRILPICTNPYPHLEDVTLQLAGKQPVGIPSVLLDEPERSLELSVHLGIFQGIEQYCRDRQIQVLLATHSPVALFFQHCSVISLKRGYWQECQKLFGLTTKKNQETQ